MKPAFVRLAFWPIMASAFIFFAGIGQAQQSASEGAAAAQTTKILLRNGTEVKLKLAQDVNSRTAREGEPVELVVAEPVKVGDQAVAEVGSRAIGTVIHSARPNFQGDPGQVAVKVTLVKVGKTTVPLRGSTVESGNRRPMIRGTQAEIKRDTLVTAYVDADTEIDVVGTAVVSASSGGMSANAAEKLSEIRVPNGTPMQLLLTEPLSSKMVKLGDTVKLQVLEDVKVGDLVVIPARTPAIARISEAKAAGRAWHKGQMAIQVESVALINQQPMPLELRTSVAGEPTNAALAWAGAIYYTQGLALFALPLAPLQHGNQAMMRRGAVLEAFTKGEAVLDRGKVEDLQPKPIAATGPATVTFYYPEFERARFHEIWIGAVKFGELKQGRRFTWQLPAGRYWFRLRKNAHSEVVDLAPGEECYVRMGFLQRLTEPGTEATGLTVAAHDVGETEAMDLRVAEFKTDKMDLNVARLQEEPSSK